MDFQAYLVNRHKFVGKTREINEVSASQYDNRLSNMRKKEIYNGELHITPRMRELINQAYANKTGEYERTLKYFIEYKNFLKGM